MDSYGYIETMGLLTAIEAADAALKAANVVFTNCYIVKGGIVTVELAGDVAAVTAAVEAGSESARKLGNFISKNVIARVDEETKKILKGDTFISDNNKNNKSEKEISEEELLLNEIKEEEESIEELDALEEIINADIPTAEGDIPLYDEVVKSQEFSELEDNGEVKIITETVKRTELDGEPYESQEKVTVIEEETKAEKTDNNTDYENMKVSDLRGIVKELNSHLTWNQVKAMNKKKLVDTLKKNKKDK
ncbi:BMC domain-containing protein [Sebaldella sp. S0638]|uniref:BMC domain-containing protein n=1 Tax=Sebaldella sp. S0638 TaxID=2957809 RepID=UPI00209D5A61|nr:BMC domain-containing protein [Sebaldella sp. S0638]MCP1225912.1 BMC domain-containing protein [Sebaldella sp. S0638]